MKKLFALLAVVTTMMLAACKPEVTAPTTTDLPTTATEPTTTSTTTEPTTEEKVTFKDCEELIAEISKTLFGTAEKDKDYIVDETNKMVYTIAQLNDTMTMEEAFNVAVNFVPIRMTLEESTVMEDKFEDGTPYYGGAFLNETKDLVLELTSYIKEEKNIIQYVSYLLEK